MVRKVRFGHWMALGAAVLLLVVSGATIPAQRASASVTPSISGISVSSTCDTAGGFTGTVTLSAPWTGTVTLVLTYHTTSPTTGWFVSSPPLLAGATFSGGTTATYAFGPFTGPAGATINTYRIQVYDASGLPGSNTKSNSVQPCTGTSPPPPPTCTVPGATGPSFLGLCSQGAIPDVTNANSPNGSQITVGKQAETVSSLCGDVVAVDPNTAHDQYSFGIYTDVNGAPDTQVATSPIETMTAAGWNCAPISASLAANTAYWLVFYSNADDQTNPNSSYGDLYYNPVSSNVGVFSTVFTPIGAPISWANYTPAFGPYALGGWQFSIFANVSP